MAHELWLPPKQHGRRDLVVMMGGSQPLYPSSTLGVCTLWLMFLAVGTRQSHDVAMHIW